MNQAVENKWLNLRDRINTAIDQTQTVQIRVPGWQAISLTEGLLWVQSQIYEGYYVDFKVTLERDHGQTVWLKTWEYGEVEPPWEALVK